MQLAAVEWVQDPSDVSAFRRRVAEQLHGQARMKPRGCRGGQYLVRDEAVQAFRELAAQCGLRVRFVAVEDVIGR